MLLSRSDLEPVLRHGRDGIIELVINPYMLSNVIQHDIRRDARNHINTAEFLACILE